MSIIVTGANGQLGKELRQLAATQPQQQFHFFGRDELDIADAAAVDKVVEETNAKFVINCAAYTAVDRAETEWEQALAINCTGAANLAAACKRTGARFVHISTDYVFAGTADTPYKETDTIDPVNAYGRTKQQGEDAVMAANNDAIIIRTSWVYSEFGNNFVKTMIRLMGSRPEVGVVADQYGSPTYAADLAAAILHITNNTWVPGIYHYSNDGTITWFEFAQAIAQIIQSNCMVKPLTTAEYPTPAKRPAYSVMDKSKFTQTLGISLKPWRESLEQCIRRIQQA